VKPSLPVFWSNITMGFSRKCPDWLLAKGKIVILESRFHQHFTRIFSVRKSFFYLHFGLVIFFVRKMRTYNVDEIDTWKVEPFLKTTKQSDASVIYRVCHGFRLITPDDYFQVNFDHFYIEHHF